MGYDYQAACFDAIRLLGVFLVLRPWRCGEQPQQHIHLGSRTPGTWNVKDSLAWLSEFHHAEQVQVLLFLYNTRLDMAKHAPNVQNIRNLMFTKYPAGIEPTLSRCNAIKVFDGWLLHYRKSKGNQISDPDLFILTKHHRRKGALWVAYSTYWSFRPAARTQAPGRNCNETSDKNKNTHTAVQ